jgi:hypothetical protein
VNQAADSQALLVVFSLIYHSVNVLGKDFPRLQDDGSITLLELLVNVKSTLDGGGSNDAFGRTLFGVHQRLSKVAPRTRGGSCEFHGSSDTLLGNQARRSSNPRTVLGRKGSSTRNPV